VGIQQVSPRMTLRKNRVIQSLRYHIAFPPVLHYGIYIAARQQVSGS